MMQESVKGEKIFIAHDKTMRKKVYDFAYEGVCARNNTGKEQEDERAEYL